MKLLVIHYLKRYMQHFQNALLKCSPRQMKIFFCQLIMLLFFVFIVLGIFKSFRRSTHHFSLDWALALGVRGRSSHIRKDVKRQFDKNKQTKKDCQFCTHPSLWLSHQEPFYTLWSQGLATGLTLVNKCGQTSPGQVEVFTHGGLHSCCYFKDGINYSSNASLYHKIHEWGQPRLLCLSQADLNLKKTYQANSEITSNKNPSLKSLCLSDFLHRRLGLINWQRKTSTANKRRRGLWALYNGPVLLLTSLLSFTENLWGGLERWLRG